MTFKVTLMFAILGLLLAVAQTQDAHGGPGQEGESDNGKGNVFGYFGPGNSDKTPGNADNKAVLEAPERFGQVNSDKTLRNADDKDDRWGPGHWIPGNPGKWPGWHHGDHDDNRHHD